MGPSGGMVGAGDSKDPNMKKMSFKFNTWKKRINFSRRMVDIFEKEFFFNLVKIQRHLKGANPHNFRELRQNNRLTAPRIYVPVLL